MSDAILEVLDVRRNYGSFAALQGVSLTVREGEIFGLLGPNGAGKTTLLSLVAGLSQPTSGQVRLFGKSLSINDRSSRTQIGIGTQDLAIYPELTASENLRFFGRLYGLRGTALQRRIDEVLELTGLTERANQRAGTFSGGQKRRLNLGVAVVHRPRILFLDEPTTGVDPQSRNHIFERVRELNRQGMTVIYTSHYMEEVQTLCPRIAILDRGKIIACDTLTGLLLLIDGAIHLKVDRDGPILAGELRKLDGIRVDHVEGNSLSLTGADISAVLLRVVKILRQLDLELLALETHEPNLERVFLHLTERTLRD